MDSNRLHDLMDNTYIPAHGAKGEANLPRHHPSLIMLDKQTDTTHHLACGCCGGNCISENAWWNRKNAAATRPPLSQTRSSSSVYSQSSSAFN
jgi:hypothetical protein